MHLMPTLASQWLSIGIAIAIVIAFFLFLIIRRFITAGRRELDIVNWNRRERQMQAREGPWWRPAELFAREGFLRVSCGELPGKGSPRWIRNRRKTAWRRRNSASGASSPRNCSRRRCSRRNGRLVDMIADWVSVCTADSRSTSWTNRILYFTNNNHSSRNIFNDKHFSYNISLYKFVWFCSAMRCIFPRSKGFILSTYT